MDSEIRHPMTLSALQALLPDAAIEPNCNGELVVYTGWRIDARTDGDDAPLIPFECPSCNCEDQDDNPHDCDDLWHNVERCGQGHLLRPGAPVWICDRPKGHDDKHMMRRGNGTARWGAHNDPAATPESGPNAGSSDDGGES